MFKSKKVRISFLIVVLLISWFGISKIGTKENFPLFQVNKDQFLIDLKVDGLIQAGSSTLITTPSRVWGNIRIIKLAEEGKYVKKDDFLIQFDTAEFMERVQNRENELEKSKASYESTKANIAKTKADLDSQLKIEEYSLEQNKLSAKNALYEAENKRKEIEYSLKKAEISFKQLVDKINNNKKINKASLRQSELRVNQSELSLQRAKDDVAKLTISSPCEGLVVYKKIWSSGGKREKVKIGSTPWPGLALMEIPDKTNMKVVLNVNEVNISSLKLDLNVKIKVDALPEKLFEGKIINIANLAHEDENSAKKVFEVEVKISELSGALKPGMSANCQIIIDQMEDVISIPIDAVIKKEGDTGVYIAGGKFVKVKTGKVSSDLIVIEEGLKEGDQIRLMKSVNTESNNSDKKPEIKKKSKSKRSHRMIRIG